jgi:hypothetical protein
VELLGTEEGKAGEDKGAVLFTVTREPLRERERERESRSLLAAEREREREPL